MVTMEIRERGWSSFLPRSLRQNKLKFTPINFPPITTIVAFITMITTIVAFISMIATIVIIATTTTTTGNPMKQLNKIPRLVIKARSDMREYPA
jgi:hypothetical protein